MVEIKQCSSLERRSVIKFLVIEKCKQNEIYRMCNVYREACFNSKNNVYKLAKHVFTTTSLSQKTRPIGLKHNDSSVKKKF